MKEPLDERYLKWLYTLIGSPDDTNQSRTYWRLFRQLYTKEFIWFIANDDNRVEDGRALRYEFMEEHNLAQVDEEWLHLSCSVLEMLIALSRRLSFQMEGEPRKWFWKLLDNLKLGEYTDSKLKDLELVDHILDVLIWRTYEPDGQGGLFPLKHAMYDQRDVEIWYQLSAYVNELA